MISGLDFSVSLIYILLKNLVRDYFMMLISFCNCISLNKLFSILRKCLNISDYGNQIISHLIQKKECIVLAVKDEDRP